MGKALAASFLVLATFTLATKGEDEVMSQASFIGGGGSTATNAEYTHISSWRQPIQTSSSTGGEYKHLSGFLSAFNDTTFRILSYGFATNPTPRFHCTIATTLGQSYEIQFSDAIGNSFVWQAFQNTNQAVGTYVETNRTPSTFTFTDDFTQATSGGAPSSPTRFYRVTLKPAAPTP